MLAFAACAKRAPEPKRIVVSSAVASTTESPKGPTGKAFSQEGYREGVWTGPKLTTVPEVVWSVDVNGPVVHPISLCGDRMFAVAGAHLLRLTLHGEVVWNAEVQADGPVTCTPEGILVASTAGSMRLLDNESGTILESYGGFETIRTPALPLEGELAWVERDGVLLTKDTQNGPMLQGPVSDGSSDGSNLFVGNIYGELVAINQFGVSWTATLPGPITGQPVVQGQRVFAPYGVHRNRSGGIAAIDRLTGLVQWTTPFGPGTSAAPSVGGFLIVPSRDGDLVALDPAHGGTRWRIPRDVMITTKPAIVGDGIYVGDGLGRIYGYDMADGGSVWMMELGAPITGDPIVWDGLLVVGTSDGRIIGLRSE